jgi:hypothetical protein
MNLFKALSQLPELQKAAKRYNTSLLFQCLRALKLHNAYLFSMEDILFWGLTNPEIPNSQLGKYLSRESRTRLVAKVNDPLHAADVDDKSQFYNLCQSANLAIPRTYGVYGAAAESSPAHASTFVTCEELDDGAYVGKPAWGNNGIGLVFFTKSAGKYTFGDQVLAEEQAHAHLLWNAQSDSLVIQDWIEPHPLLRQISLSRGVQSVRVVTFMEQDGNVHILFCRFKFIRRHNNIDNFTHGESGNLLADVDAETGQIISAWMKNPGEIGLRKIEQHPDSLQSLCITLPYWDEILAAARSGARTFPKLRCLAWDIAFSPEGPIVLEANQNWEIFPTSPYRVPPNTREWKNLVY